MYGTLVLLVVVPPSLWPVSYRVRASGFVVLFALVCLLPPVLKVTSDLFPSLRFLNRYLGRFPFQQWTLYYRPLTYEKMQEDWPDGVYYAVLDLADAHQEDQWLLLDDVVEPLNVSGLSLSLLPAVIEDTDAERRRSLVEFLFGFLSLKLRYYERTGRYNVSERYLGRFAFPTANEHRSPGFDLSTADVEAVEIYHVGWCSSAGQYEFDRDRLEWCQGDETKRRIARYEPETNTAR